MSMVHPSTKPLVLIHTYHTEQAPVQAFSDETAKKIHFFMQKGDILHPILNIDTPNLENLDQKNVISVLQLLYPILREMNDQTLKLYLYPRICGGMISNVEEVRRMGLDNTSLSDKEVGEKIKNAVKDTKSYTWIQVNTNTYNFKGEDKIGREILLEPTTGQAIWNYFKRIFDQRHAPVNINAASQAVLGSRDPYDVEQLQKTYGKNIKLVIRVSCDLESVYFGTR